MMIMNEITAKKIGAIVTNLQSLEFLIRIFLNHQKDTKEPLKIVSGVSPHLSVGDWVNEDYLTNYKNLRALIDEFNRELASNGIYDSLDGTIVDLRDAIAHGRVFAEQPNGPFWIIKYSKAENKKVQVKFFAEMTIEWLDEQETRTFTEMQKILNYAKILNVNVSG